MKNNKLRIFPRKYLYPVLAVVVGAVPARAGAVDPGDASRGRDLYNTYCQACHGAEAVGLGAFTGDLAAFRQRLVGTDNMPDMSGIVTESEAADLFAFVESLRPRS